MTQTPPPYQPPPYQPPPQWPHRQYPPTPPKRPGGLTALAVINFVFAGFGPIMVLGLIVMIPASRGEKLAFWPRGLELPPLPSVDVLYYMIVAHSIIAVLLVVSGIGYLKMSKTAGYVFGNIYAIASIANRAIQLACEPEGVTAANVVGFVIGVAYQLITLILLNGPLRKYFNAPPAGPAAMGPGGGYRF